MTDIDDLITAIGVQMDTLTAEQADILAKQLAVSFVVGWQEIEGAHKKISLTGDTEGLKKRAIQKITADQLGYIGAFNDEVGNTLTAAVRGWVDEGLTYNEIKKNLIPFVDEVFGPNGQVIIDNVGKKRTVIEVGKDGRLRRVEKTITRKYSTNPNAYAEMLSQSAVHNAYEDGRTAKYKDIGVEKWQYISVGDDRTRPHHLALSGNVYTFGTDQSDMAEEVMHEPRCRCRKVVYFDDPKLDVPESTFTEQKSDAGLKFTDDKWTVAE